MSNRWGALLTTLCLVACGGHGPPAPPPASGAGDTRPGDAKATRAQLTAVIRAPTYLDGLTEDERAHALSEPFVPGLIIVYMVDVGGAARVARIEDLAVRGITRTALRAVAEWNVANALRGAPKCEPDTVATLATGNFYESSRLLLDKQWADLTATKGRVVVAVPKNDTLFVTCDPSADALKQLTVAVQNTYPRAPHPVSSALFAWSQSGWQELPAP